MATMMMMSAANVTLMSTSVKEPSSVNKTQRRSVMKLASFAGMKAESHVSRLGLAASTEEGFAAMGARVRVSSSGKNGRKGGALSASCNVASEIARIVPIISGLVLVGIALGFVLLRIEAVVEEAEAEAE